MKNYDVIIVGAGPAGIFTAYELTTLNPELSVLLVEKGRDIYKRYCPILKKTLSKCPPPTEKRICRLHTGMFDYKWFWRCRSLFRWQV